MTGNTRRQSIKRWFWKQDVTSIPNADAFARLYEETYLIVFRYVYGLSGGPLQEAEDLTAETYARAWKTRHHFRGDPQAALGWLLRIARNLAIDLARRRKFRVVDESVQVEFLIDPGQLPEIDIVTREQIAALWHMLAALSEEVREMLVLRYMLGWQIKQIAAHLYKNENTVTVTIKRAIQNLERDWTQLQENDHE